MPQLLIFLRLQLYFACIVLTVFLLCNAPVWAQEYQYVGQVGENAYDISVRVRTEAGKPVLILEEDKRYSEHTFDKALGTKKWVLRDAKDHHDFTARRSGNEIHIQGTFQGEPVDKIVAIDERPWFNKLDHGLSEFAASDQKTLSFWVLKLLSDLDPVKFEAEKQGTETITIGEQTYPAVKIKLTIDNFLLSKLWSAELWYRASDGLFLRYEGVNGGPGTPETVIELGQTN
uniref:DUF3108 domain-containing protein n=1 Tax=Roseihalotalea indica TaxID=2867963 RepID=A0AA49JJ07_9BACT|nr:hypothetical protein K4G66_03775 [Tunicatimonas sp. TK19036]